MNVVLSPFSRNMKNGERNPKSPTPEFWRSIIPFVVADRTTLIQIGNPGEEALCEEPIFGAPLRDIETLVAKCDFWISADNFLPHLAHTIARGTKRGVVVFSQSDPNIFGYAENVNLLASRAFLRPDQFGLWESAKWRAEAFPSTFDVVTAINRMKADIRKRRTL